MQMSDDETHRQIVLRMCRAVMPGVQGVVLASDEGGVLAHEAGVGDADTLARHAVRDRGEGASALVREDAGLYLVVFVPPQLAAEWRGTSFPAATLASA